jgi:hypothetical protein
VWSRSKCPGQEARDFSGCKSRRDASEIRLETGNQQPEAIALYESHGFDRIPPFGKYVGDPVSLCFEKPVVGANVST